jgi:hypothetical protein
MAKAYHVAFILDIGVKAMSGSKVGGSQSSVAAGQFSSKKATQDPTTVEINDWQNSLQKMPGSPSKKQQPMRRASTSSTTYGNPVTTPPGWSGKVS